MTKATDALMDWELEAPAIKLSNMLWSSSEQKLPHEILRLDEKSAGIVIDIDGIDYILTMQVVPKQRPRPTEN